MLINVKIPTIVGILTFICRINFVLSGVEYDKSFFFKNSGPGLIFWNSQLFSATKCFYTLLVKIKQTLYSIGIFRAPVVVQFIVIVQIKITNESLPFLY